MERNIGSRLRAHLAPASGIGGRGNFWPGWLRQPMSCFFPVGLLMVVLLAGGLWGQTNCEDGNGVLDSAQPKTLSAQDVIKRFGAAEAVTKEARLHYTYKQDVLMQTLSGM